VWREYLQAREFEASLQETLSDAAADIVASDDEINRHIDTATSLMPVAAGNVKLIE
jgi:hypothetical protein